MAKSRVEKRTEPRPSQFDLFDLFWERLREKRIFALFAANIRILIGFAFVPAGLKKVLGQPFADPGLQGAFYDFVYAFHGTGPFYRVVGVLQLVVASLLMTQRFASLGAALMFPIVSAILLLVWSTAGIPTIVTVTLMWSGLLFLLLWDVRRWRALLLPAGRSLELSIGEESATHCTRYWERCGLAVLSVYGSACALQGGVYRPRGADFSQPGFYLLMLIALFPVITWFFDRHWYRSQLARR